MACRVMSCLATTFCTVSTILVVSSKREAMSSLAMSCPVKSQHSRCSQSAATVLMTWCGGAPQSGKTMTVERPLRRITSCSLDRSRCQHVLISFPRFHTASVWNCSTTIHNKLKLCNRPWMVEISHVIRLACSCATILSLSAPS